MNYVCPTGKDVERLMEETKCEFVFFVISASIFRDCVTQEVDTISYMLGEIPRSVFATGSGLLCDGSEKAESENVSMTMRFTTGVMATIDITRAVCMHDQHLEVSMTPFLAANRVKGARWSLG